MPLAIPLTCDIDTWVRRGNACMALQSRSRSGGRRLPRFVVPQHHRRTIC